MPRTRLQDIADQVGISRAAVCRVLNDQSIRIGEEKRRQIKELADELGYRPDVTARALRGKKTKAIGVVVPSLHTAFYPELISAMADKLFPHGYQTLICNTADRPDWERRQLDDLLQRRVDGLVVSPAVGEVNRAWLERINQRECPVILFDRYWPESRLPYVTTDNYAAAEQGVRWLAKQGVRRLFYMGEALRNAPLDDRLAGVKAQTTREKLELAETDILLDDYVGAADSRPCRALWRRAAAGDGIFLESTLFLPYLLSEATAAGESLSDRLHATGFDIFQPSLSGSTLRQLHALREPLPVFRQPIERIGELAAEYFLAAPESRQPTDWQIKVPAEFFPAKADFDF